MNDTNLESKINELILLKEDQKIFGAILLFFLFYALIIGPIIGISIASGNINFIFILLYFIPPYLFLGVQKILDPIKLKERTGEIYNLYKNRGDRLDNIDTIQLKCYEIQKSLRYYKYVAKIGFWLNNKSRENLKNLYELVYQISYTVIFELRGELINYLQEQRNILENSKSEVEKNLTGSPELLAVSEEQKIRLDRQIEQFENLQKILVKV